MNVDALDENALAPVLLVSKDPASRNRVREILHSWSLSVDDAWDVPAAAQRVLFDGPHAAVICDDRLANGSAIDLMRLVRGHGVPIPFVVVSENWRPLNPAFSRFSLVTKPLHALELWESLNWVLDGGLVRFHLSLDARDAAAWSRLIAREDAWRPPVASRRTMLDQAGTALNEPAGGKNLILQASA